MGIRELRIHGVGGSPGEALLGLDSPDDAVVVGEGRGTVFLARRRERTVEGYDWGKLTSGSALQPLWVLLLPFTLVNVAGWTHPAFGTAGRRLDAIRLLVHASAALLTASWVLWIAIIAVDHLGYQWLGQHVGWPTWIGGADTRVIGAGLGVVATLLATWLLVAISRSSRTNFEAVHPDESLLAERDRPSRWGREEDLTAITFFSHERSMTARLRWHDGVIAVTLAVVLGKLLLSWGGERLLLGEVFVVLGALQIGVILLLAVVSWPTGGQFAGMRAPRAMPAAAVTLAVALTNGVFSGATLLAARTLPDPWRRWGPELALIESFVVMLVLWVVAALAWFLTWRGRGHADDVPRRRSATAEELDGADDRWRAHVAGIRGIAAGAHAAPRLLVWLAALFLVSSGIAVVLRIELTGPPWQWLRPPEQGVLVSTATWLLPILVLAVMGLVWRATTRRKLRRGIGIVWDVLTFWPRRYHPLAVRPYTERAVPEFQARIKASIDRHEGLLVSAHSQGSVIAFAALAPLPAARLERTALLTYGCPLTTLYGQVFPAYFGADAITGLRRRLEAGQGGWRNLYRRTDPIGGAVIGPGDPAIDDELADPATGPRADEICDDPSHVDPEPLRRAWVELCGHSYYYREQRYKDGIVALRRALGDTPRHSVRCDRATCREGRGERLPDEPSPSAI